GCEPSTGARKRSRLVDQGSSAAASRAAKTMARASGEKADSSVPPKGLEGLSAFSPRETSTGSPPGLPPARGRTNRWVRRPSLQVSQRREKPVPPRERPPP